MDVGSVRNSRGSRWPLLALTAGVVAWLWPLGVGGRMPVGGDVTSFQIGLMAYGQEALRQGRLPLWDERWGYGFPGLAESQMGVYSPAYVGLFGVFPLELAYTLGLVLHTFLAAFGARWAALRFGASPWGAALAGLAFGCNGWFLIHLPHQWASATGCWMPWAWGLAWDLARRGGRRRAAALAAVLAVQMTYGHFQLAFITQVTTLILGVVGGGRTPWGAARVVGAWSLGLLLAAAQLLPTWQLARLTQGTRDAAYLGDFAMTPLHLINAVAPELFHRSPLWRPLVWDPLQTAPEEVAPGVGLVPLLLALAALRRRDAAIWGLVLAGGTALVLSLGPNVPGFDQLGRLPGFSFFRAPARWTVAASLALALLAARGFSGLTAHARGWIGRAAAGILVVVGFAVAGVEVAMMASDSFRRQAETSQAQDSRVELALARQGQSIRGAGDATFSVQRHAILAAELARPALLALALAMAAFALRTPRRLQVGLWVLAAVDLVSLGRNKPVEAGPMRSLVAQSPTLARLASDPGRRTVTPGLNNLALVAKVGAVPSYRTLDLPTANALTRLAELVPSGRPGDPPTRALAAIGAEQRLLMPAEVAAWRAAGGSPIAIFDDPALAGWVFNPAWVATRPVADRTFGLWSVPGGGSLVRKLGGRTIAELRPADPTANPLQALETIEAGQGLRWTAVTPEAIDVALDDHDGRPAVVLLTRTWTPNWRGEWSRGEGADRQPAEVVAVLDGWQGVAAPEQPGDWRLSLRYDRRDVVAGQALSALGLVVLLGLVIRRKAP